MIDYHCHLLPSIDDGPMDIEESINMAYLLSKNGYDTIYCTPHMIKNLYDASNEDVIKAVNSFQNILKKNNISLNLHYGREYILDNYFHDYIDKLLPLENTNYVLIEFQPKTYPGMIKDSLSAITRKGFIPMIAHPERCHLFHFNKTISNSTKKKSINQFFFKNNSADSETSSDFYLFDKDIVNWLIGMNCFFQNNLLSHIGFYGESAQKSASHLKSLGIYTHYGTDAHSPYCIEKIYNSYTLATDNAKIPVKDVIL
jgi:protein-tyrosine phosphatase